MNIPKNELWNGFSKCYKNAEELYKSAKTLYKKKLYGSACSLMVLSTEESAKACCLFEIFISGDQKGQDLKKCFRQHKHKHNIIYNTLFWHGLMEVFYKHMSSVKEDRKIDKDDYRKESLSRICDTLKDWTENKENDPSLENSKWKKLADDIKKKGFYVDYENDTWLTPQDLNKDDYLFTENRAKKMINMLKQFYVVQDPIKLKRELSK